MTRVIRLTCAGFIVFALCVAAAPAAQKKPADKKSAAPTPAAPAAPKGPVVVENLAGDWKAADQPDLADLVAKAPALTTNQLPAPAGTV